MADYDASQAGSNAADSGPIARPDVDALPAGSFGPASGNAITGAGTVTGAAGADTPGAAPASIVEVHGAGGATSASGDNFQANGQYGVLSMDAQGNFNYVRNPGTPDGVKDVFGYTLADAQGARSPSTLTIDIGQVATAAADGIVNLPAGVELSDIHVVGRDLVIDMPDGTHMVIPGGAVFVPQLVIGDVAVPPSNVAALLIDTEPQPAAGPPQSSGGNFAADVPPLDPGVPLGDLIPPTELTYHPPDFKPEGQFIDTKPTVVIVTPDNPAGAVNAHDQVDEAGLPARTIDGTAEPQGSDSASDSEGTSGTIVFEAKDGLDSVTVNGVVITADSIGDTIQGEFGTLTITSVNLAAGQIGYTYAISDNTDPGGDGHADHFTVVVTDSDGDAATGTLTVDIIDDTPTARNDTDSADVQTHVAAGNVITAVGTTNSGADTVGADDAHITGLSSNNVSGHSDNDASGGFVVDGEFGTLTMDAQGQYTYVLHENAPGGSVEVFTYTLTDGDGDTSTATLTIDNPDHQPTGGSTSTTVDEDGLSNGIPGGPDDITVPNTDGDNNESTNAGTLPGGGGDGELTFDLLTTGAPTGFQYIDGPNGSIIVQQDQGGTWVSVMTVAVDAHTGDYTVTVTAPIDHPTADIEDSLPFTINYTVTDADNDHAPGTLNITVNDDSPQVTGLEAGPGVTLDETTAGSPDGFPISADSGTAVITGTVGYGADGPGTTAYGVNIVGGDGTSSGLATSIGNHPITLVQIDADTIEGQYQDGGTQVAFTIDIDSGGVVTVTQQVPLEHLDPTNANDTLDLSGLVNATITVTDADNDSAGGSVGIGGNITFFDDGPSVTVDVGSDANILLETQDHDTIGGLTDHDTADFSGVFTIGSSSGGGDGAASTDWSYALGAVDHTDSGLKQGGATIYLYQLGDGSVVGSTAGTEGDVDAGNTVFSVTVDSGGVVTLNQFSQIDHPIADDQTPTEAPFVDQTIHLADGAVTLTATATVTDNDGDTATGQQTIDIGANIIFDDDGPTVTNPQAGDGVSLDETTAGSPDGFPISATSDTAAITATTTTGADTPASTAYGLTITGGSGSSSGLATSIGDHAITLVQIDADTVQGQYQDGGTQVAFTVDIGSDGKITVTQEVPLEHLNPNNPNDTLDLTGHLNATITITDYDGDTASGSAPIGDNIEFFDDGPSINVTKGSDANIILETQDHDTIGAGVSDTAQSTANFGGVFAIGSSSGGGDGAPAPSLAFALGAVDHTDSGLTQTGSIIYLYQLDDGSVVGSTSNTEAGVGTANTVFSVTVDSDGVVTLTQFSQIDHPIADDPTATGTPFVDQSVHLADGAITLTASATITDNDGDHATDSETVGIGNNIIFDDDGPTVTNVLGASSITFDETSVGDITGWPATSVTSAAAMITATTTTGADVPAATTYGLALTNGLTSESTTLETAQGNHAITLVQIDSNTIQGQYQDGGTQVAFVLDMGSDGKVTYTQNVPLEHADDGNTAISYNDTNSPLDLSGLVQATITVTDYDGDTASGSTEIGDQIHIFDDGPTAVAPDSITTTDEPHTTITASLDLPDDDVTDNFGADGPGTITFANVTDGQDSGLTAGGATHHITYWLSDDAQTVEGRADSTDGVNGTLIFTVHIDQANSDWEYTQFADIDNGSGVAFNDLSGGVAGNPPFKLISSTTADNLEMLVTPINETSVNSDSDDIAAGSQFIEFGTGIRFDFGQFSLQHIGGNSNDDTFTIDQHSNINGFKFTIDQISNGTVVDIDIAAVDGDVDDGPDVGTAGDEEHNVNVSAADVIDDITTLKMFDTGGNLVKTFTGSGTYDMGTVSLLDDVTVTFNGDGTVHIENLPSDFSIQTYTATGYNRLEVNNSGDASPDGKFSLSHLSIETFNQGSDLNLNFDVQVTDSDGDYTVVDNGLHVTLQPAGAQNLAVTNQVESKLALSTQDTSHTLVNSNDNHRGLEDHRSFNNAALLGAIAGAGLSSASQVAAESHHVSDFRGAHSEAVSPQVHSVTQFALHDAATSQSVSGQLGHGGAPAHDMVVGKTSLGHDTAKLSGLAGHDQASHQTISPLSKGTEGVAHSEGHASAQVTAAAIVMPSAAQLAGLANHGGGVQHVEGKVVAQVLSDALHGGAGHGPNLDALINALPGQHGQVNGLEALASHGDGAVSFGHSGGFAGFTSGHGAPIMEIVMMHQDAPAHV